jgi:hypothetical protein
MTRIAAPLLGLLFGALLALPAGASQGVPYPGRPDPAGTPTPVAITLFVRDIERIFDREQQFLVDMILQATWRDPRLEHDHEGYVEYTLEQVWHPRLILYNGRGISTEFPPRVRVTPDGTAKLRQRVKGTLASPLDLRRFPFDSQVLPVSLVSLDYTEDEVALKLDAAEWAGTASVVGWTITDARAVVEPLLIQADSGEARSVSRARFVFEIDAQRLKSYYAWKVIVPLTVIVLMSWAVFFIDPKNSGPQIAMGATSILTLIAFLFSLGSVLPPVSYLTRIDVFVYGSLVLVFLVFAEAILTSSLAGSDETQPLARSIDRVCRLVFPAAFVAIQALFWAGAGSAGG